jgi:hypothetical protein
VRGCKEQFETAALNHYENDKLLANPVIYAKLSTSYQTPAQLDEVLNLLGIEHAELPWDAAHLAGQAFAQ